MKTTPRQFGSLSMRHIAALVLSLLLPATADQSHFVRRFLARNLGASLVVLNLFWDLLTARS